MIFDESTCTALTAADETLLDAEAKAEAAKGSREVAKKALADSEDAMFTALREAREEHKGAAWSLATSERIEGLGADFERRGLVFESADREHRRRAHAVDELRTRVFSVLREARDHPLTASAHGAKPDPDAWCKVELLNLLGEMFSGQFKEHAIVTIADYLGQRVSTVEKLVDEGDMAPAVVAHTDEVVRGYLERRERTGAWPKGARMYPGASEPALPTSGGSGDGAPTATGKPAKSLPAGRGQDPAPSASASPTESGSSPSATPSGDGQPGPKTRKKDLPPHIRQTWLQFCTGVDAISARTEFKNLVKPTHDRFEAPWSDLWRAGHGPQAAAEKVIAIPAQPSAVTTRRSKEVAAAGNAAMDDATPNWWHGGWMILANEADSELPRQQYRDRLCATMDADTPAKLIEGLKLKGACVGRTPEDVAGPAGQLAMLLDILGTHLMVTMDVAREPGTRGGGKWVAKKPCPTVIAEALRSLIANLAQRGMLKSLWDVATKLEFITPLIPECAREIALAVSPEEARASMGKGGTPADVTVSAPATATTKPKKPRGRQEATAL